MRNPRARRPTLTALTLLSLLGAVCAGTGIDAGAAATPPQAPPQPPSVHSGYPTGISRDGRVVAFDEFVTNWPRGQTLHWVRDAARGRTLAIDRSGADVDSATGALTPDGRYATVATGSNTIYDQLVSQVEVFDLVRQVAVTVSVNQAGVGGNGISAEPAISAGGRYVAFTSAATDLVPGDGNGTADVFVHDLSLGGTSRVSLSTQPRPSGSPAISADGRYVAFTSAATDLVPGDTNRVTDVFVRDRRAGRTRLVSVSSQGWLANHSSGQPALSADGRYLAFTSTATNLVPGDSNGAADVFVRDLVTGRATQVSAGPRGAPGDGPSSAPAISADGRYVAFESLAANLVAGDTNLTWDVFVRDRSLGSTERITVNPGGDQADYASRMPVLSPDGRYVAFQSRATNLAPGPRIWDDDVYAVDRVTHAISRINVGIATPGRPG